MRTLKEREVVMSRTISLFLPGLILLFAAGCQSRGPVDVLVVTGGHGYDHEAFAGMFDSFEGLECDIEKTGKNPGALFDDVSGFGYDSIVLYNFGQELSEDHRENFKAVLDRGVGLTVVHHAMAAFPKWRKFEDIIGGTFVLAEQTRDGKFYPNPKWKHDVDMDIEVVDPGHAITEGVEDFTIHDETYKEWVYHEGNHLLLATGNELSNRQIAWTRPHPKTRVFYIQLGHGKQAFENENFKRLLRQGIIWTSGKQ